MNNTNSKPNNEINEVDLFTLIQGIWKQRLLIVVMTAVFAIGSIVIALMLPNKYRAEVIVMPTQQSEQNAISNMAGQLGGLASLAGINLNSNAIDQSQIALAVLESHLFFKDFIERNKLLPELIAVEHWDRLNNKLRYNADIYDKSSEKWVREVEPPKSPEPSSQEAHEVFKNVLTTEMLPNGMIKISFEHLSPFVAKKWLDLLVHDLNEQMRKNDVAESTRAIEFLEQQVVTTTLADAKVVLFQLIEEHTKKLMFSEVRDEYAFKTIDPAVVPEKISSPNRALVCIVLTFTGGLLSMLIAVVRFLIVRRKAMNSN